MRLEAVGRQARAEVQGPQTQLYLQHTQSGEKWGGLGKQKRPDSQSEFHNLKKVLQVSCSQVTTSNITLHFF